MVIKKDIETRADIDRFIRSFYEKVTADETIGFIFTELFPLDWNVHIPLIVDFWETILLDHPVYKKNAMQVHYDINNKFPLKREHFDAWLNLFNRSLEDLYTGGKTELAKKRAGGIAQLMMFKMGITGS